MGRALDTNFVDAFSSATPPRQRTCLDLRVQARWRGGVVFEKGIPKFVSRARPAAGYLRSGGWGWLAHFADNPRWGETLIYTVHVSVFTIYVFYGFTCFVCIFSLNLDMHG